MRDLNDLTCGQEYILSIRSRLSQRYEHSLCKGRWQGYGGAVAVKSRPSDRLMRRRGTVLAVTEGGVANSIGGPTQVWSGTGIEIGASHPVSRGSGAVAEVVEVGVANRLPRPAASIGIVEGHFANIGAGAGLGNGHTRKNENEEKKESHEAPGYSTIL